MKPDRVVIGVEPQDQRAASADARAVRPVHANRRADHGDGHGQRRAVQVRGELDSRDANLVHERDRQRLRAVWRRRRSGPESDWRGSTDRHVVLVSRRWLWRQLLSQGHAGAAQVRQGQGLRLQDPGRRRSGQPASEVAAVREDAGALHATCRGRRSRSGVSRSSRAPTTCARRPRSWSSNGCWPPARRSGPTTRSARETARRIFDSRVALAEKSYDALAGADALAIVTEWNEFREPDFGKMRQLMRSPVVFDGRNIYSPEQMRTLGFTYFSIGR